MARSKWVLVGAMVTLVIAATTAAASARTSPGSIEDTHVHEQHEHSDSTHDHEHRHDGEVQDDRAALLADAEALVEAIPEITSTDQALRGIAHQAKMDMLSIRLEAEAPEVFAGVAHLGDGSRSVLMIKGSSTRSARSLVRELGIENVEIRPGFELTRQELLDLTADAAEVVRQISQVDAFTISTSLEEQKLAIVIASKGVSPDDIDAVRSLVDQVDAHLDRKSSRLGDRIDLSVEDLSKFDDGLESLYGGDKMVSGGNSQAVCTTAFGVNRGTTRGMLMAAHCSWGGPSTPRHYVHEWGTTHWNGQLTIQDVHGGYFGDLMWMTSTGWESPRFYAKKNTRRTATGFRSYNQIDPGDYVCGFGRRTNSTAINCTTVAEVGFWKNQYGNMVRTWGQFLIEGDSGGPWYFWKTAIGTHHGNAGTGTCPNCDTFSVVANALALWNLDLLTG